MGLLRIAGVLAASLCPLSLLPAPTITVKDVPTARGSIRIAHYRPDAPLANLIVLPGGDGVFELQDNGLGNFYFRVHTTSRNRDAFVANDISVILVDVPSDMPGGISDGYRSSAQRMAELGEVLREVRSRDNVPTWLVGGSKGAVDAVSMALAQPAASPFGLILVSPYYAPVLAMNLESLRRPTLLLTHQRDTCVPPAADAPVLVSRLISVPALRHVQYTEGTGPLGCDATGPHGLGGLDAEYVAEVSSWVRLNAYQVQAPNYQGLWWRSPAESEPGWGVNVTQQGNVLFATWFTYDGDGSGMWLVMSRGERIGDGVYSGALYRTTGPSFSTEPFNPAQVSITEVGRATFTFEDSNNGVFSYTVNGIAQSKPVTKQVYATPVPACVDNGAHGASPNYQALWWGGQAESGWGVNIAHQGDILFATWYTYGNDGRGVWYVMPETRKTGAASFAGPIYRTTGPAFSLNPWSGAIVTTRVGSATFTFRDASNGAFAYVVDAVSQSKAITRQIYGSSQTVCR